MIKECKVTQQMVDYIESHRKGEIIYDKEFWLELGEDIVVEEVNKDFTRFRIRIVTTGGGCWLPVSLFNIDPVQFAKAQDAEEKHNEFCMSTDWNAVRIKASMLAMSSILNGMYVSEDSYNDIDEFAVGEGIHIYRGVARLSIDYANALIDELKEMEPTH